MLREYGVGRPSVRAALTFGDPSLCDPPPAGADFAQTVGQTKTCGFVPRTKGDKKRGRPARQYKIPTITALCSAFNVTPEGADPIVLADIRTVGTYRAALNRELIRRRPGIYTQSRRAGQDQQPGGIHQSGGAICMARYSRFFTASAESRAYQAAQGTQHLQRSVQG